MTAPDYWWAWCGTGPPPPPGPGDQDRPLAVSGVGRRRFAAYPLADPPWGTGLKVAVDGGQAAAFIGWLSNGEELRRRFEGRRRQASAEADLALHLYRDWGADGLQRLRGSYAVLLWDGERDTLIASTDPMGQHSLFWARTDSGIVLSDSTQTLLRRCAISRELNRVALADALRQRFPDLHETFFAAVRRVAAGHTLTVAGDETVLKRTWQPTIEAGANSSPTALEEFEEAFARATRRCLDFGSVGIWLSGGLDSVSVATMARDLAVEAGLPPPAALSLGFPDPGVNEEDVQRSAARQLGLPLVLLGLDEAVAPRTVLEATADLAETWPAPMLSPWLPSYLALGQAGTERGCRAILTGTGGDEFLGVSAYLAADLLASFDVRGLAKLAVAGRRSFRMSVPRAVYYYLWFYSTRRLIGRKLLPALAPGLLAARDRRQLARSTPEWLAPDPELRRSIDARVVTAPPPRTFYADEATRSLDLTIAAMEHEEFFEASRRLGMPILAPFFDPDLVELLHGIAPSVLNQGGRNKGLVRAMLDRRFPDLAFGQQKKVEAAGTLERLLADQGPDLRRRVGPASTLEKLGVVDASLLDAATAEAAATGSLKSRWKYLFQAPLLETFARAHYC